MDLVAHRAGNRIETARSAFEVADLVELDVHLGSSGSLEIRHEKRVWFTSRSWERWFLLPVETEPLDFDEFLAALDTEVPLWLDLKGISPRLAEAVRSRTVGREGVTVSSKAWWLLRSFADDPAVRTFRSAGNRFELLLTRLLPAKVDGAVVHRRLLSDRVRTRLGRQGAIATWAVDDLGDLSRLADAGIAAAIVDDLDLIRAAREIVAGDGGGDPT